MRWMGKTAVITGSTSGIGLATARLLAARGAHVVTHGLDPAPPIQSSKSTRHVHVQGDLVGNEVIAKLSTVVPEVDLLVNNAGVNVFRGVESATEEDWEYCIRVNLRAHWLLTRSLLNIMPPGSAIVFVSSNHAQRTLPGSFPYNVAKAGMLAMTNSFALELAPRGIRANAVVPGYIETPANDRYFSTTPDPTAARRRAEMLHPLGRLGAPEDVAEAVSFLGHPDSAGFITGASLVVDGGRAGLLEDGVA